MHWEWAQPSDLWLHGCSCCQVFWWGGVAGLASARRQLDAQQQEGMTTLPSEPVASSSSRSSGSSSDGNRAAALCPRYHQGAAWPVLEAPDAHHLGGLPFAHCLELLLVREALGYLPGAMQQLKPFRAEQCSSSSRSSCSTTTTTASSGSGSNAREGGEFTRLILQWPVNLQVLKAGSSSSSSSSGSGSLACQCRMPTCHLCTPPPPVTLQQLRLVLEVVCLSCQEISPQALQAPLLLALLLQRASPELRAAFLNSEDGTRLLVALQLAAEPNWGGARTCRWLLLLQSHGGPVCV
jgi:hypothetical protein